MKTPRLFHRGFFAALLVIFTPAMTSALPPISLHPANPHYFVWRGKPTVIITSGEHYGAVLNLDFDYAPYLKELEARKLNNTRIWSGAYLEPAGAFNIASNTLAPNPRRFIAPWPRVLGGKVWDGDQLLGGISSLAHDRFPKFDLTLWNTNYFVRLRHFMQQASARGVVVEMNLFCPMYEEPQWTLSPQNAINNVNGIGDVARTNVYTLDKNGGLLAIHEAMTRKIVTELNEFDNLYYEICNEPYFGGVTLEWQHHIADVIVETEKALPNKHLISQNIANGSKKVTKPHPAISIFNFHYASPPKAVAENYALNKAIGDNETGFKGTNDTHYRMEAWEFILAGGALYNNLDYSFVARHERGDFVYPKTQPGGGNPEFRRQLTVLRDFINSFDFVRMKPDKEFINSGVPDKMHSYALAESGHQYAAYFFDPSNAAPQTISLTLLIEAGDYRVDWVDVLSGKPAKSETIKSPGAITLTSPEFRREVALRIRK
jgi:hypothetical protein